MLYPSKRLYLSSDVFIPSVQALSENGGFITIKSNFFNSPKSSKYCGVDKVFPLLISPVPLLCKIKFIFAKPAVSGYFSCPKIVTIVFPFSSTGASSAALIRRLPLPAAGSYNVHFLFGVCLILPMPIKRAIIRETSLGV